jgi:hypothetical protein
VPDGRRLVLQIIGAFILIGLVVFLAIILLGAQARYFEPKYDLTAGFEWAA